MTKSLTRMVAFCTLALSATALAASCCARELSSSEQAQVDDAVRNATRRLKALDEAQKRQPTPLLKQHGDCSSPSWRGFMCRQSDNPDGSANYSYLAPGMTQARYVSGPVIERLKVRCDYKAKNYFVNDALRTHQEIFDECMRSEIWLAGH